MATLRQYLLNVADAINAEVNKGFDDGAPQRLQECATIAARVSQLLPDGGGAIDAAKTNTALRDEALREAAALDRAEEAFAADQATRAQAGLVAGGGHERRVDKDVIETYLRNHPQGAPDIHVREARILSGGRSKQTVFVSQEGGSDLPDTFILRQDWAGGATDTIVEAEYELLRLVADGDIKAPAPLLVEPSSEPTGAPFVLLTLMPGAMNGGLFAPPASERLAMQFADQLAQLHNLPVAPFEQAGVPTADLTRAQLFAGIEKFRENQATLGMTCKTIDAAIDWLSQNLDGVEERAALIHNDLGFHNSLTEGEDLTAILDWELAHIGNPAADLGYCKHFIEKMTPWRAFLDRYEAAGGHKFNPHTLRFYTLWSGVRLYGLIMQARAALAAGLVRDPEICFACADNTMLLIHFLSRELREAWNDEHSA